MQQKDTLSSTTPIRVRFAPSPTGMMHLGNVRTALMNYLFARQKGGSFIVRIEDTDPQRNFDPEARHILNDLAWLGIEFDEGPGKDGGYGPYFQSERTQSHQERLNELEAQGSIYRCFCTEDTLSKKRQRQISLKRPPRYDRACLNLSEAERAKQLSEDLPFIWRFAVDHSKKITINDLGHGSLKFDCANFSDFPLTRADGSFTFIFANAVDDIAMKISHVFRGDDHLSNTVNQAMIYEAFGAALPVFWHMPILCNIDGKKLSKRDFGFSLNDLRNAGYLHQALNNYLAIIGNSFEQEIMDLPTLVAAYPFDHISSTSHIKYDVEKLRWVNHKSVASLPVTTVIELVMPLLTEAYAEMANHTAEDITNLVALVQPDITTLPDVIPATKFFFIAPDVNTDMFMEIKPDAPLDAVKKCMVSLLDALDAPETFMNVVKTHAKTEGIKLGFIWPAYRMALTGSPHGMSVKDIVSLIGSDESRSRITNFIG